jgi:hypothetical protein
VLTDAGDGTAEILLYNTIFLALDTDRDGDIASIGDVGSQKILTRYACEQIWGMEGLWTDGDTLAESTYQVGAVVHHVTELFNSTWLRNNDNGHKYILTNTPGTSPAIFNWEDAGQDVISVIAVTLTFAVADWLYDAASDTWYCQKTVPANYETSMFDLRPASGQTLAQVRMFAFAAIAWQRVGETTMRFVACDMCPNGVFNATLVIYQ